MQPTAEELVYVLASEAANQLLESVDKIEHCLNQLSDDQVWWRQAEAQNSIGNIILHLCGNGRQWIVSGIGGEPDVRDRPKEFSERRVISRAELLQRLHAVVGQAAAALSKTTVADLLAYRRIQGFDVTGLNAVFHSVPHFVGHTYQIVYITRCLLGDAYRFQWTPATPEQGAPP